MTGERRSAVHLTAADFPTIEDGPPSTDTVEKVRRKINVEDWFMLSPSNVINN
jgi:hypothetical protein